MRPATSHHGSRTQALQDLRAHVEELSSRLQSSTDPQEEEKLLSMRSRALLGLKNNAGALDDVDRVLQLSPRPSTRYHKRRAEALAGLGRNAEAGHSLFKCLTRDPDDASTQVKFNRSISQVARPPPCTHLPPGRNWHGNQEHSRPFDSGACCCAAMLCCHAAIR